MKIPVHTDCRHYRTNVPCRPHKQRKTVCSDCTEYDHTAERILVIKLDAMGDVLRTTSCLPALKREYPHGHVTWITRANAVPLLAGNPAIDRVLAVESNYLEFLLAEDFDLGTDHSIEVFAAIISSCDWILTPDSLGYHVACAVGTPAVCVVGPTSPWELDRYETNVVIHADLECIACYRARCPLPHTCMDRLTSRAVWPWVNGRPASRLGPSGVSAVPVRQQ
jgi:ADP-heptose:LPS heptosyltransferase